MDKFDAASLDLASTTSPEVTLERKKVREEERRGSEWEEEEEEEMREGSLNDSITEE